MRHGFLQVTRSLRTACLCRPLTTSHVRWSSTLGARQWSTPLAKTVADAIEATGPISIAAYMRQCLTSPNGGYYTGSPTSSSLEIDGVDQFGARGDFITSPEISQIFGELVAVWFLTEWIAQGRPASGVQLIELGPGRGTLMSDMLRTLSQFRSFRNAVDEVWCVEASEGLRQKQRAALCGPKSCMKEIDGGGGWECESGKFPGLSIRWVEDVALLPRDSVGKMPFVVAHEFFDALPIHAFESVPPKPEERGEAVSDGEQLGPATQRSMASKTPQWRELLVTPTKRKFVLPISSKSTPSTSPSSATADSAGSAVSTDGAGSTTSSSSSTATPLRDQEPELEPEPEFHLTLAKASTPSSLILPEAHTRYRAIKSQVGSRIEISPESSRYIQDFAIRIGGAAPNPKSTKSGKGKSPSAEAKPAGAALLIDYGPSDPSIVPSNSLRGIKAHTHVSPFTSPGQTDISADVDFIALADAALAASEGVEVHGPVEQGLWLSQLGIKERAERLLKELKNKGGGSPAKQEEIETAWKRLVEGAGQDDGKGGMGKAYKVMCIVPEGGGKRRPVGFGGGVV